MSITALDLADLERLVAERYINVQRHPTADLYIYNYTPKAQYDGYWTEATLVCRGLILDGQGAVRARPFRKFFNLGEHKDPLPDEPFEVFEKVDGSLGVTYWVDGQPYIATRGSFTSEQSQRATRILRERYGHVALDPECTYLFEIIYPSNRIVVDYGDREDLVLLAIIHTATGAELTWMDCCGLGFPTATHHEVETAPHLLHTLALPNAEGFVIRFASGLRLKVKFEEYVRLHHLLTGINARHVWEMLRDRQALDALLDRVPDEFNVWLQGIETELWTSYTSIEEQAKAAFVDLGDRKTNAERYKQFAYPHLLFAMLDGKPYDEMIWKLIRPEPGRPFKVDE